MSGITKDNLKEHLFLRGIPDTLIEFLLPLAEECSFKEGETIIEREAEANKFYLIRDGLVSIELDDLDRGTIDIETLSEGDPLGWSWAHPPYVWQFTARAENTTTCYGFPAEDLRERCQMEPELGYRIYRQLMETISNRLAATRLQLLRQKDVELPPNLDSIEIE